MSDFLCYPLSTFGMTVDELNASELVGAELLFARTPDLDDYSLIGFEESFRVMDESEDESLEFEVDDEGVSFDTGMLFFFGGVVSSFFANEDGLFVKFEKTLKNHEGSLETDAMKLTMDTLVGAAIAEEEND